MVVIRDNFNNMNNNNLHVICNVKYKYKPNMKNIVKAMYYSIIIFGSILNYFSLCTVIITGIS